MTPFIKLKLKLLGLYSMHHTLKYLIYSFIIIFVTACGGGGGATAPAPTITSFTASSSSVTSGGSVNLTAVFANGTASINNSVGTVTSNIAKSANPTSTITYVLTVTNTAGASVTASVIVITDSIIQISWNPNPETAVNRTGGGYKVYYSSNSGFAISDGGVTEVDAPYSSGATAPTSTQVRFFPGTYYMRIIAYSALDAPDTSGGSVSTATSQTTLVVP